MPAASSAMPPIAKSFSAPATPAASSSTASESCPSPSPRNMDDLAVDPDKLKEGEVWVQFVNYYPGKEDREEKA